jgi:hypothetical protein
MLQRTLYVRLWRPTGAFASPSLADLDQATSCIGTTGALDTTGANLIVIAVSDYSGVGASTVSDSKGNSWTNVSHIFINMSKHIAPLSNSHAFQFNAIQFGFKYNKPS